MKRRQNVLIILFVIAVMAVYTGYEANKPQPIDWSPNFLSARRVLTGRILLKMLYLIYFRKGRCLLPGCLYGNNCVWIERLS